MQHWITDTHTHTHTANTNKLSFFPPKMNSFFFSLYHQKKSGFRCSCQWTGAMFIHLAYSVTQTLPLNPNFSSQPLCCYDPPMLGPQKLPKKPISALCRLDRFLWPLLRVCTCHFLLALLCANCLMMRFSIYYWSLDLLPPLFTCLYRLPPAKRRAIHLPNTDSQLPPWMFCSIRLRFPCSYSSGLSSVWEAAGPGKLGKYPWACISRWQIVNSRRRWWFLKISRKEMTCLPCGSILARLLQGLVKCTCCLWGGETVKLVPNSMNQIG